MTGSIMDHDSGEVGLGSRDLRAIEEFSIGRVVKSQGCFVCPWIGERR